LIQVFQKNLGKQKFYHKIKTLEFNKKLKTSFDNPKKFKSSILTPNKSQLANKTSKVKTSFSVRYDSFSFSATKQKTEIFHSLINSPHLYM
jgi:hypothetical protein